MKRFDGTRLWMIALFGLLLSACSTAPLQERWQRAHYGMHLTPQAAELNEEERETVVRICPAGVPVPLAGFDPGPTEYAVHLGYALQYSNDLKIPLWVCEHLTAATVGGPLSGRESSFATDPQIKGPHSVDDDYVNSEFDRGHQAANDDQGLDPVARKETFYLSNVAPQMPKNNQRIWAALEKQVREWATEYDEVWVVTGGLLYDPKEEDTATADGWVKYFTIGRNGVAVPTYFYKIVARRQGSSWTALAFVLENREYPKPPRGKDYVWQDYVVPVSWVEDRAGLDFMPDLPATATQAIEARAGTVWHGSDE